MAPKRPSRSSRNARGKNSSRSPVSARSASGGSARKTTKRKKKATSRSKPAGSAAAKRKASKGSGGAGAAARSKPKSDGRDGRAPRPARSGRTTDRLSRKHLGAEGNGGAGVLSTAGASLAAPAPPIRQVVRPDGSVADAGALAQVENELLLKLYRAMWRSRRLDERMTALQRQGRIGFYGTSTGEEAAVFGSAAAFEPQDWVFPALRQGGVAIWRGYELVDYVAQCIGNDLDQLRGRQMPCHYADRRFNHVSWSSVIANQLPQAVGAAMAARYRAEDVVVAAYLGDGATSEPDFHVAMNFAAVYGSPCVFVCHNNQWAISVPFEVQTASDGIAVKAQAYGMPGVRVDGNDVVAVLLACREAVARARAGGGPTLVECLTYRLMGHTTADDPGRYRDEAEAQRWAERDPLIRARRLLCDRGLWDEQSEQRLGEVVRSELDAAIAEAERAGAPPDESIFDDVFEQPSAALREQRESLRAERER